MAELVELERPGLVDRWQTTFGQAAPRYCHVELLRSALAWEMQARETAMKGTTRRHVVRALAANHRRPRLAPGTQLLREWNGRTHRVSVLVKAFEYDGRTYRSLTAITRVITGTPWSGPASSGCGNETDTTGVCHLAGARDLRALLRAGLRAPGQRDVGSPRLGHGAARHAPRASCRRAPLQPRSSVPHPVQSDLSRQNRPQGCGLPGTASSDRR